MVKDRYLYGRPVMVAENMITVIVMVTQIPYIVYRYPVQLSPAMYLGTVKHVVQH